MSTKKVAFAALFISGALIGTLPLFFRDKGAFSGAHVDAIAKPPKGLGVGASTGSSALGEELGTYNGQALVRSQLSTEETFKLFEAEKKVYDTVQELLMQRYVQSFFEDFQKKNNHPSLQAAQEAYFNANAKVADAEVKKFLADNASNPSLQRIPEDQREEQIRRYLEGQSRGGLVRQIASEGRRSGKLQPAISLPVEPRVDVGIDGNAVMGNPNAKVTIVEFADYQCPFCARMVPTLHEVLKKYDGKVNWVYRDFPLMEIHPQALPAAVAANCSGLQGKYYEMHQKLFEKFKDLGDELYLNLATEIGLDLEKFKTCLKDPAQQAEVLRDQQKGQEIGVQGTPAYFINGRRISGGVDVAELSRLIEEELEQLN